MRPHTTDGCTIQSKQATDIYKRLLLENRDDLALNVYVAMCYYKLDYYDVSLEILAVYLQSHPLSPIGQSISLASLHHEPLGRGAESLFFLSFFSSSLFAGINLRACNHFRLYNGKAAEAELKALSDKGINIQATIFSNVP